MKIKLRFCFIFIMLANILVAQNPTTPDTLITKKNPAIPDTIAKKEATAPKQQEQPKQAPGFNLRLGRRFGINLSVLYDVLHNSYSPYFSATTYRFGFSF
ncbi:MAG: hypothetical protein ACOYNC_07960 [Bacteroidales bacterium]